MTNETEKGSILLSARILAEVLYDEVDDEIVFQLATDPEIFEKMKVFVSWGELTKKESISTLILFGLGTVAGFSFASFVTGFIGLVIGLSIMVASIVISRLVNKKESRKKILNQLPNRAKIIKLRN